MLRGWVRMVQPGHRTWPGALPHLLHDPIKLPAPRLGCLNALWTWNRRKGIITEMGGSRTRAPATQPAAPTTSPIHCLAEKKNYGNQIKSLKRRRDPLLKGVFRTRKTSPLGHSGYTAGEDSSARRRTRSLTSCHTPRNIF